MKTNPVIILAIAGVFAAAQADEPAAKITANATNRFEVTGMSCNGCAQGLAAELKLAPGVVHADVSLSNKLAVVAFDTNRVTTARLVKVIGEAGYQARLKQP